MPAGCQDARPPRPAPSAPHHASQGPAPRPFSPRVQRSCSTASGALLECARKAGCVRAAESGRRPHGALLHRRAAPPRRPDGAARPRGSGPRARDRHPMALARDRDGDAAPARHDVQRLPGWSARDGPLAGLRRERQRRASGAAGAGERSPVARSATPEEGGPTSDERQPAHTGPWESGPEARRDRRKPAGKAPMPLPPAERVFREDSLAIPVVGPAREQRQGACCARCLAKRIQPCASDTRRGCDEDTRTWSGERRLRRAHRCRARPVGTVPGRGRGRGRGRRGEHQPHACPGSETRRQQQGRPRRRRRPCAAAIPAGRQWSSDVQHRASGLSVRRRLAR
jgi:hypothetical protein